MSSKRFINVEFNGIGDRIKIVDLEDISELRRKVKDGYGTSFPQLDQLRIRFRDQKGNDINELEDVYNLNMIYFEKGGNCLSVYEFELPSSSNRSTTNPVIKYRNHYRHNYDGLQYGQPYFKRPELLQKLIERSYQYSIVVLQSSACSGKTSLLDLYMQETCGEQNNIYINCISDRSLFDLLKDKAGVDLDSYKHSSPFKAEMHNVIILDDAQEKYNDKTAWAFIVKNIFRYFPNCSVIISAIHSLRTKNLSPACLQFSHNLSRDDFMLTFDESLQFLSSEFYGLGHEWSHCDTLKKIIAHDCAGLIGALRVASQMLKNKFFRSKIDQSTCTQFYFSQKMIKEDFIRCFSSGHSGPLTDEVRDILQQYFINQPTQLKLQNVPELDQDVVLLLIKCGILKLQLDENVVFTSRLAQRFYFKLLFPNRSNQTPRDLKSLIIDSIGNLSSDVIQNSVHSGQFPKDALFQHLFMNSIISCTPNTAQVHAELSVPFSPNQSIEKIPGEIDFYVDGDLCWGIELLINGRNIGEHLQRFTSSGKYALLNAKDYVVVDFRGSIDGSPSGIDRHPKRITVFFKIGFYKNCLVICGLDDPIEIRLSN